MARLKVKYTEEIAPALMKKFEYKSVMQIPTLSKIIVNVGCGESKNNAKEIEAICKDIATITGQKPVITKARKSIASFKIRAGMPARILKLAMDLRALVMTGFWPVMVAMSLQIASISLALFLDSPQPTLTMILLRVGICMTLLYSNFFIRAGAISSVYLTFSLAISEILLHQISWPHWPLLPRPMRIFSPFSTL